MFASCLLMFFSEIINVFVNCGCEAMIWNKKES